MVVADAEALASMGFHECGGAAAAAILQPAEGHSPRCGGVAQKVTNCYLLYSTLLYSTLLCCILVYSAVLYTT